MRVCGDVRNEHRQACKVLGDAEDQMPNGACGGLSIPMRTDSEARTLNT